MNELEMARLRLEWLRDMDQILGTDLTQSSRSRIDSLISQAETKVSILEQRADVDKR